MRIHIRERTAECIKSTSVFCLVFLLFLASTAASAREYPVMKPDAETLNKWLAAYNSAPAAIKDPIAEIRILAGAAAGAGSSFSLLDDLVYTPSERDQGTCGSCWIWAGTGVLELAMAGGDINDRLSVQFFDSCASLDCSDFSCGSGESCACGGGNLDDFVSAYNELGFAVPWSNTNASYGDIKYSDECGTATACSAIATLPRYLLTGALTETRISTYGETQAAAIENIKNVLEQDKGVYFIFTMSTSAWDAFDKFWSDGAASDLWDYDGYGNGSTVEIDDLAAHAVLIVGYNEEDSDTANHYWIALNSWGVTDNRTDGTFRVKMYQDYSNYYSYRYQGKKYAYPVIMFETIDGAYFSMVTITTSPSGDIGITSDKYTGTVSITTSSTNSWTASFDSSWTSITSSASGIGSGHITFEASANTSTSSRTANLSINGSEFVSVIQEGAPAATDTSSTASSDSSSGGGGGGICFIAAASII